MAKEDVDTFENYILLMEAVFRRRKHGVVREGRKTHIIIDEYDPGRKKYLHAYQRQLSPEQIEMRRERARQWNKKHRK